MSGNRKGEGKGGVHVHEHDSGPGPEYQAVIGLEIHVQLHTRSKMFCGSSAEFGATPNTHVCPVCLGLPGALPVINARAVELALRAAVALDCTVHEASVFARKHYFYPDLPKGYQITQYDRPLATGGWLDVPSQALTGGSAGTPSAEGESGGAGDPADDPGSPSAPRLPLSHSPAPPLVPAPGPGARDTEARAPGRVRIRRIHLEEDAGKSVHDRLPGKTAVDLNRAGVPLIEIVTEPDLGSPEHARAFLTQLKQLIEYIEISDCDMEKGSLRVDANVSVRRRASTGLGTKTEVKNLNSFSAVERALAFEIRRQVGELEAGRAVVHETLLWDAERGEARSMRSKEESDDYRYFPEPDLPPLVLRPGDIEAVRTGLPELPAARARRFVEVFGLPAYDAAVLTATREIADYYEAAAAAAGDAKAASNWVMGDVLALARQHRCGVAALRVQPGHIGELARLVADGTLSRPLARQLFEQAADSGRSPAELAAEEGLGQVSDSGQLEAWVAFVVAAHPQEVSRFRAGEEKLMGFFMGQLMKESGGRADPQRSAALLRSRLRA